MCHSKPYTVNGRVVTTYNRHLLVPVGIIKGQIESTITVNSLSDEILNLIFGGYITLQLSGYAPQPLDDIYCVFSTTVVVAGGNSRHWAQDS